MDETRRDYEMNRTITASNSRCVCQQITSFTCTAMAAQEIPVFRLLGSARFLAGIFIPARSFIHSRCISRIMDGDKLPFCWLTNKKNDEAVEKMSERWTEQFGLPLLIFASQHQLMAATPTPSIHQEEEWKFIGKLKSSITSVTLGPMKLKIIFFLCHISSNGIALAQPSLSLPASH